MSEELPKGLVVAHGGLAQALVEATDRIVGLEPGVLEWLSNEGLSPPQIRDRITEMLGTGPGFVFTDLKEGSCGMAARSVCLQHGEQVLLTGVNLPMLLDFATKRGTLPVSELVERLVTRGRGAVESLQRGG